MSMLPEVLADLHDNLHQTQSKKAAWKIINEYFSFFDVADIHDELWLLTAGTLTSDEIHKMDKTIERQNLIFFFEYTKIFVEAVHLLCTKRK